MRPFLFSLALINLSLRVIACDCPDFKPLEKERIQRIYPVIFYGKVIALGNKDGAFVVKFKVITPFAGKLSAEMEIIDPNSDCSPGFGEGQEWLIYARYKAYGKAGTDLCTPSRMKFTNEKDDYNIVTRKTTFASDIEFLKINFGIQPFFIKNNDDEILKNRELVKPGGYGMAWMILIGTLCLVIFYTLFNRFFK